MDVILIGVAGVFVMLLLTPMRFPPKYRRWRGSDWGTLEDLQYEHLVLFTPLPTFEDEEDES